MFRLIVGRVKLLWVVKRGIVVIMVFLLVCF